MHQMENFCKYQQKLNFFLQSFDSAQNSFSIQNCQGYGLALLECNELFYGRFLRCLITAKKKIIQEILNNMKVLDKKQIKSFKSCLKFLTTQHCSLLSEGILSMYLALVDLKKKQRQKGQGQQKMAFLLLLKSIVKCLDPLLFIYFVYKQYKKKLSSSSSYAVIENTRINSQKKIIQQQTKRIKNQQSQQIPDQQIIQKVQQQLGELSVSELIQIYLKEEEDKIIDSIQVCRICSQKIKLKNFQMHIKNCSKRVKIETQLKQLQQRKKQLNQQILKIQKNIMLKKDQTTQKQLFILRILGLLKQSQQKRTKCLRRNTQIHNTNHQPIQEIKNQILIFQEIYGIDPLLNDLVSIKEQMLKAKKKLSIVEVFQTSQVRSSKGSDIQSLNSLQYSINKVFSTKNGFKTKKSIFASKKSKQIQYRKSIQNLKQSRSSSLSNSSISINTTKSQEMSNNLSNTERKDDSAQQEQKGLKTSLFSALKYEKKPHIFKSMKNITNIENQQQEKMSLDNFQILKLIGKGAFGKVYLVRRKTTKDLYALKHIMLDQNKNQNQMQLIKKQHQIFKKIAGDHLIRAPFAFSQNFGHFFVLQFMPGGDLSQLLSQSVYLQEDHAKFYLAQIVLAVEHLHHCEIIHRDLKPQNIVIDKNGHIKLTDFGLSDIKIQDKIGKVKQKFKNNKINPQRSNRRVALVNRTNITKIIGTPDYIAPEIINQTSINNHSIDWWSLGVMAYQMLVGCRPFCAMTIEQVLKNIIEGKIQWPPIGKGQQMMSPEAYDLISKLLNKNFQKRLGSQSSQQIKTHPFFSNIDWNDIKKQTPPILPLDHLLNLQKYSKLTEDTQLKKQITQLNSSTVSSSRPKNSIKLQNFVRYDFLLEQTCESVGQRIQKQKKKIERIKKIGNFIEGQQKQNLSNSANNATQIKKVRLSKNGLQKNVCFNINAVSNDDS